MKIGDTHINKAYVGGRFRPATEISGGAVGSILASAFAPAIANVAQKGAEKLFGLGLTPHGGMADGNGLRPHGTGLTPHGGAIISGYGKGEIPNPSGAGTSGGLRLIAPQHMEAHREKMRELGYYGKGMEGEGIADWFKQAGKDIKKTFTRDVPRVLTSAPVKSVIKDIRGVAVPIVKEKVLPQVIDYGISALPLIPKVGIPLGIAGEMAKPYIKQGAEKLIDLGDKEAEKAGYGAQYQGFNLNKEQINHIGSKDVALDRHSIDILDGILGKRGGGLRTL